jgi:hypothetical protein
MLTTPILLITFNRPTHTRRSLEAILAAQPMELYVFQDGARPNVENDEAKCTEVKRVIEELVDKTKIRLHTLYENENLGCGPGPVEAITWFFGEVEQGIIIEDDCVLASSGFLFYEYLLERYKNDSSVSAITATNLHLKWRSRKNPYLFATVGAGTLGCWASWASSWKLFDYQIREWQTEKGRETFRKNLGKRLYYDYYENIFDMCTAEQTHIWDYQWFFAKILHNTLTIVASRNMVSNIGFDSEGTHTIGCSRLADLPVYSAVKPLGEVDKKRDALFDWVVFQRYYYPQKKSILKRILLKLIDLFFQR